MLGLALAAVAATVAELAYRFVHLRHFTLQPSMWAEDADLLYKLNPEHAATPGSFRGAAPRAHKTELRIVCLGGSTTYGHDLPLNDTWPVLLAGELRARGVAAEVINAGTPGYGSRQQLLRYRRDLAALDADLVLINEGWNRTGALSDKDGWVPFGIARQEDGIATHTLFVIAKVSMIVRQALTTLYVRARSEGPPRAPLDPHHEQFIDDITSLTREITQRGQRPVLIVYPSLLHADMLPAERDLYAQRLWEKRSYHPDMLVELERKHRALRAIAAATPCAAIDVQARFAGDRGEARLRWFLDQMHLSAPGNRKMAAIIADALLPLIK